MQYNQPYGMPPEVTWGDTPYINGNPSTGTAGSIPPAASIEYPQREIVNMIKDAGIQTPSNSDLHQLARAIQSRKVQYAHDTGTANAYAANLTPAPTQYYDGLEVILLIAHENSGASVLNINALGNKNIVRYDGLAMTGGELKANQFACFRYDGTQWQHMWPATYTVGGLVYLKAPKDYYVNTNTGNDNFNGLQPTVAGDGIGGPFKTIQKAFNQTALYNLNGYAINIHVADGTYAPTGICGNMPIMNGSGQVNVYGNQSTPGNVVIQPTVGSGFIIRGGYYVIDGFTFFTNQNPGDSSDICAAIWGVNTNSISVKTTRYGQCYGGHMCASGPGFISGDGPFTVLGGSFIANMRVDAGGIIALNPINKPTMNITGTGNMPGGSWAMAGDLSVIRGNYLSLTGAANIASGQKYFATTNSIINTSGAGVGYFPGPTAGSLSAGGQYV